MQNGNDVDPMTAYVAQAWSLEGQLPILMLIAALLGFGKGGVPGFATVATAANVATSPTHIAGGLGLAVALQVPILTMIDISAAWLHWKDLDFDTIKVLLPVSFLGMALGQWMDRHLSDSSSRLMVGIMLLLILFVQMTKDSIMVAVQKETADTKAEEAPDIENDGDTLRQAECGSIDHQHLGLNHRRGAAKQHHATTSQEDLSKVEHMESRPRKTRPSQRTRFIWAAVVGLVGGAATMLTNAMGPILNVYLLSVVQLSPSAYIGTRAMFFCFLNLGKLPMRFYSGTLGWEMMPLATFLGVISVLGVFAAKPIMLSMSESNFVKLELAVVAFAGLRLCYMGMCPS